METVDKKRQIMKTGVFRTENDAVLFLIAKMINDHQTPMGAWALKAELEKYGINYGTATVGRYLKELDSRGIAEQKSNQGRILTEKGRLWLKENGDKVEQAQMRNEVSKAMHVGDLFDLIDLVQARKAIEVASVRLAVKNASKEDLKELHEAVMRHYRCVAENADPTEPALEFHSLLVSIGHNRFMKSMLELLLLEERKIEKEMCQLITRERGDSYVVEHDDIARAVEKRDEDLAAKLLDCHIQELIDALQEQIDQTQEVSNRL